MSFSIIRTFRDLPIRFKLMLVIMLTTSIGLLLAGAGLIAADSLFLHSYLQRDLSTLTRIVGDNSTAGLDFDEPQAASETLSALKERPHVIAACTYRKNGTILATYSRVGAVGACPPPEAQFRVHSTQDEMVVSQPILLKGGRIGTLVLRYDLAEIFENFRLFGLTVLGVLVLSGLVSLLLSSQLRALIATPISQLANAAASVSATKDYSIRAENDSRDELGLLVDAFNQMLSSIQSRDTNLTQALVDRENALRETRNTRDFLRTTLASIGDAVISTDAAGRVVFVNPVALSLLRKTEAETTGKSVGDVFTMIHEASRAPVESPVGIVLNEGRPIAMDDRTILIAGDGTEIPIEYRAAPILNQDGKSDGAVLVSRDVTERYKVEQERLRHTEERLATEERLRQTAKLESLGVLAGGIAHDFNNLLVGVLGNASLAQELLPKGDPVAPIIQDVISASEKAAQLTHQMLAYSGKGRFIIEYLDLSLTVEGILPLIARTIPKLVSVQLNLGKDLRAIEADKSQIQQVLMNLVINAAEACGQNSGSVFITTKECELQVNEIAPAFGLAPVDPGLFVCLEVRDTGTGMSDEVKIKLFDPFFTTKFTGRGLGLSAVLGIIRSHKGAVVVESKEAEGTAFRVFFPASEGKAEAEKPITEEHGLRRGAGLVLVIDDEETVRRMAKSALERNGYEVLVAEDGEAGVRKFRQHAGRLSMVLLDLTMPVMDGESALKLMQQIDPGVKVLLSSGFDGNELAERFKGKGITGFLQKPYTAKSLVHGVREIVTP